MTICLYFADAVHGGPHWRGGKIRHRNERSARWWSRKGSYVGGIAMITKLAVSGYRSLWHVIIMFGQMTLITGGNGSGRRVPIARFALCMRRLKVVSFPPWQGRGFIVHVMSRTSEVQHGIAARRTSGNRHSSEGSRHPAGSARVFFWRRRFDREHKMSRRLCHLPKDAYGSPAHTEIESRCGMCRE